MRKESKIFFFKSQVVIKHKNSNCEKTKKKLLKQNSKTQIVRKKLMKWICEKTQIVKKLKTDIVTNLQI